MAQSCDSISTETRNAHYYRKLPLITPSPMLSNRTAAIADSDIGQSMLHTLLLHTELCIKATAIHLTALLTALLKLAKLTTAPNQLRQYATIASTLYGTYCTLNHPGGRDPSFCLPFQVFLS